MARTVLVVDDNVIVRNVVREVLGREGYSVLEARNYEEALALCESLHGEQIDALIVDHGLPQTTGRAVAEQIVKSCPDLKVLVISGWPFHMVQAQGGVLPGASFLPKPFSARQLAAAVNDMFSGRLQELPVEPQLGLDPTFMQPGAMSLCCALQKPNQFMKQRPSGFRKVVRGYEIRTVWPPNPGRRGPWTSPFISSFGNSAKSGALFCNAASKG